MLKALPESRAAMEQAFEILLEQRSVLRQRGEVREMLENLREAEALAERLKDDRRRGRVCAIMTTVLSTLNDLDEALATGTRAVEIAEGVGDLSLGVITKSCLEEARYYRGEYEHVVDIAIENLAALPTEWAHENLGLALPPSIFGRAWLIMSLADLGRFAEAAQYEEEATGLAEATQHAYSISWAHFAASMLHLLKHDWPKARSLIEHWIGVLRAGNVAMLLPWAVASSAWALAQLGEAKEALSRVREAEPLLERQAERGIVGHRAWAYHAVSRACLLLGRYEEARRLGNCSLESSRHQPGFAAHALHLLGDIASHPDQFDAESGAAYYRQALAIAEPHGMRPLIAHCRFGLGNLYDRIGKPEQARENLAAATTLYREMGMDVRLAQEVR
jgi:tetratricopeptide (TPR) repeat protein